jgi:hypothetical protein
MDNFARANFESTYILQKALRLVNNNKIRPLNNGLTLLPLHYNGILF